MWFSEILLWHAHMQGEGTRMCVPQGQEIRGIKGHADVRGLS